MSRREAAAALNSERERLHPSASVRVGGGGGGGSSEDPSNNTSDCGGRNKSGRTASCTFKLRNSGSFLGALSRKRADGAKSGERNADSM